MSELDARKAIDIPSEILDPPAVPDSAYGFLQEVFNNLGPDPGRNVDFLLSVACRLLHSPCALYAPGEGREAKAHFAAGRFVPIEPAGLAADVRSLGSGAFRHAFGVHDLSRSPAVAARNAIRQGFRSCLTHPVDMPGQKKGILAALFHEARPFSEKDEAAIGAIASAIALVENNWPAGRSGPEREAETDGSTPPAGERPAVARRRARSRVQGPASSYGRHAPVPFRLTPAEMKVANLIKLHVQNKRIADRLGISVRTVEVHRNNIRRKLGITGRPVNLRTHLLALEETETQT